MIKLFAAASAGIILFTSAGADAQQRRDLFGDPQNLKVLPEDISSDELSATMRGFTRDLGLRCSSCHVGEEGQPIFDYDFASDEKALKLIARDMMRMTKDINKTVSALNREEGHQFVDVNCVTCHRGQNRPRMIEDILAEAYAAEGIDAALGQYTSLREQFYGGFVYDFTPRRLAEFAQSLASAPEDSLQAHDLNVALNPEAGASYAGRGQAYAQQGETQKAVDDLKKAIDVDPAYGFLQQTIDALEAQLNGE